MQTQVPVFALLERARIKWVKATCVCKANRDTIPGGREERKNGCLLSGVLTNDSARLAPIAATANPSLLRHLALHFVALLDTRQIHAHPGVAQMHGPRHRWKSSLIRVMSGKVTGIDIASPLDASQAVGLPKSEKV